MPRTKLRRRIEKKNTLGTRASAAAARRSVRRGSTPPSPATSPVDRLRRRRARTRPARDHLPRRLRGGAHRRGDLSLGQEGAGGNGKRVCGVGCLAREAANGPRAPDAVRRTASGGLPHRRAGALHRRQFRQMSARGPWFCSAPLRFASCCAAPGHRRVTAWPISAWLFRRHHPQAGAGLCRAVSGTPRTGSRRGGAWPDAPCAYGSGACRRCRRAMHGHRRGRP
jgi:hypothetical protein